MPLKLYKRGETWWIRGSHLKQTLRRTTGTNDREAAEAILAKTIAEITSDHVYGRQSFWTGRLIPLPIICVGVVFAAFFVLLTSFSGG